MTSLGDGTPSKLSLKPAPDPKQTSAGQRSRQRDCGAQCRVLEPPRTAAGFRLDHSPSMVTINIGLQVFYRRAAPIAHCGTCYCKGE